MPMKMWLHIKQHIWLHIAFLHSYYQQWGRLRVHSTEILHRGNVPAEYPVELVFGTSSLDRSAKKLNLNADYGVLITWTILFMN